MRLTNPGAGYQTEGDIEELADNLAAARAEEPSLIPEIQSRLLQDGLPPDVPEDVCASIVEFGGFRLLDDDGAPAEHDVIVSLGRMVWDKLVELAELGMEDESTDVQSWL